MKGIRKKSEIALAGWKILVNVLIFFQVACFGQVSAPLGQLLLEDSVTLEPLDEWIVLSPGQDTVWQVGLSRKQFLQEPPYDSPVIITGTVDGYPPNLDESFTVAIPESYYSSLWPEGIFSFYHRYQTDSPGDGGFIEISYDYGETWVNVLFDTNHIMSHFTGLYTGEDTLSGGVPAFTGSAGEWIYTELHWVWLALVKSSGSTIQGRPMIRFRFLSDSIDTDRGGWAINRMVFRGYDVSGSVDPTPDGRSLIYPNPATDYLHISFPVHRDQLFLTIYSTDGKIALKKRLEGISSAGISRLNPGFYVYTLKQSNQVIDSGKFYKK